MIPLSEIFKQAYAKADTAHRGDDLDAARKAQLSALKNTLDAISKPGVCKAELKAHSTQMYIMAGGYEDEHVSKFCDVHFGSRHGNPTIILTTGKNALPLGGDLGGYDLTVTSEQQALVSDLATKMAEHNSKWAIQLNAERFIRNNL